MYIPDPFLITDPQIIREFLDEYPFGLLTAYGTQGRPEAAHLPFVFDSGEQELFTHLAVHNPLATVPDGTEMLAVFTGEHGYVSSSWYAQPNAPTWNYMAVQVRGRAYFLTQEELWKRLVSFTRQQEKKVMGHVDPEHWPAGLKEAYLPHIRGLRIAVSSLDASFKLSQNRNARDFECIVNELDARQPALARFMRKHYPGG